MHYAIYTQTQCQNCKFLLHKTEKKTCFVIVNNSVHIQALIIKMGNMRNMSKYAACHYLTSLNTMFRKLKQPGESNETYSKQTKQRYYFS